MGRQRIVKPEVFTHEGLFRAEKQSGFPLRLAFIGLWTQCDREGRFEWRPERLRLAVVPWDGIPFDTILEALAGFGFVYRYEVDGKPYGVIPTWHKHQPIHHQELKSRLPEPPSELLTRIGEYPKRFGENHLILDPCSCIKGEESPLTPSCSEPENPASEPPAEARQSDQTCDAGSPADAEADRVLLTFPTVGRGGQRQWALCEGKLREYREAFPGLDVLAESRKALQWCRDNPAKRKTPRGMPAFLWRWFERAQNSGRTSGRPGKLLDPAEEIARIRAEQRARNG